MAWDKDGPFQCLKPAQSLEQCWQYENLALHYQLTMLFLLSTNKPLGQTNIALPLGAFAQNS
jgi:hypothetical protein